jgi:hypothetical protein
MFKTMMPSFTFTRGRGRADHARQVFSVFCVATIGATGLVALAYWLGAAWLSLSAMGLPAGVWIVILLSSLAAAGERRRLVGEVAASATDAPEAGATPIVGVSSLNDPWASSARRFGASAVGFIVRALSWLNELLARTPMSAWCLEPGWEHRLSARLGGASKAGTPLRIGLSISRDHGAMLVDHASGGSTTMRWFSVPRDADPEAAAASEVLDAVVSEPAPGVLRITTLERAGADSAWFDWSKRRPFCYEAVFPVRVDPLHVHLDLSDDGDVEDSIELVADLTAAAAMLSRHPARLSLEDRVLGRHATAGLIRESGEIETFRRELDPAERVMVDLAERVCVRSDRLASEGERARGCVTAADRVAARVVSAWISGVVSGGGGGSWGGSGGGSWGGTITSGQRRTWVEACARVVSDEPEVLLRLAAVRFSMSDDDAGIDALRRADALLRREGLEVAPDPVAFLQAELEHGPESPMTLGRVAAGLCLSLAGVPAERIPFLIEDLLDDMRFSNWLVGRDQDRALLIRIMRELAASRGGEHDAGEHGQRAAA